MRLTRKEVESKKTANGGYTRDTLAAWGVPWPPPKGWKHKLIAGHDETDFYESAAWLKVRHEVLERDGLHCWSCGHGPEHGVTLHVDHIRPQGLYPEPELDKSNLITKCSPCNVGKGDRAA